MSPPTQSPHVETPDASFFEPVPIAPSVPTPKERTAEGKALGVSGTPAFFVNGRFLSGAKPFDDFAKVINAELTRLKIPVPPAAPKQKV